MYADRYGKTGIKPGALSVAIGLNGAVIAALMFASPEIVTRFVEPEPMITENIPLPIDPPPIPKPKLDTKVETRTPNPPPAERPFTVDSVKPDPGGYTQPSGPTGMDGGVTGGTGTVIEPPYVPPHVAVVTGVQLDPSYARFFQPAYPGSEMRAGREGRVTVRVLVGTDGRVKQVELVSAASDLFFEATKRQALSKWRFKPATRDGVPEEGWRTMSVSFVINDDE